MTARALHTTVLRDGRVLLIAGSGNSTDSFAAGTFKTVVWDPSDGSFLDVPTPEDMFCSGHVTLADGRVLIQGGTKSYPSGGGTGTAEYAGLRSSYIFDPATNRFTRVDDANEGHWYPTLTMLGTGDVWMAGGLKEDTTGAVNTEMWCDLQQRWYRTDEVPQTWSFWGLYPHMFQLNDGRLFYSGAHVFGDSLPGTGASIYEWPTARIDDVPGLRQKDLRDQAASVLLPPAQDQEVLIVGGGNINTNTDAINLADIIDLKDPTPAYRPDRRPAGPREVNTEMWCNLQQRWYRTDEVPQTWSFWGLYPHMFQLNDGRLFYSGAHVFGDGVPGTGASLYQWQTARIDDVPGLRQKNLRDQAASVLLPPAQDQKVLIVGGGNINTNTDAIKLADIIDLKDPSPAYRPTADLPGPGKMYVNAAILPDRTVLTAHGARHNRADEVLTAAIFHPDTETWQTIPRRPGAPPVPLDDGAAPRRAAGVVRLQPGRQHVRAAHLDLRAALPVPQRSSHRDRRPDDRDLRRRGDAHHDRLDREGPAHADHVGDPPERPERSARRRAVRPDR